MALSGTIADWSFADILQVISAQQKSGTLDLEHGDERVTLLFADGKIVDAELHEAARQSGFLRFLVDTGRIAPASARELVSRLSSGGRQAIDVVEESELIDGERWPEVIAAFTQELIYRVLQWEEGDYEFAAHPVSLPSNRGPIATEGILFEGMRRIDEWSRIAEIVQPDTLFRVVEGVQPDAELPQREKSVWKLVDGIQDVRALGRLAPLTEYELGETLVALVSFGLIEVAADAQGEMPILELAVDDLEPEPRFHHVLRVASLLVLIAASVAFGIVSHGSDWASDEYPAQDARLEQAARFALDLYREQHDEYPQTVAELETIGITLGGLDDRFVYRRDGDGYALIPAPRAATLLPLPLPWFTAPAEDADY
jgi:hypothetical protein